MKLTISCLNDNKLMCKCEFDCKSATRCICEKRQIGRRIYYHDNNNIDCSASPLTHDQIHHLIEYHYENFTIEYLEYVFTCPYNRVSKKIDLVIPDKILKLVIGQSFGKINQIPELPDTLTDLYCTNNNLSLKGLPKLPSKLKKLCCGNCRLKNIEPLPNSLEMLICEHNDLKYINVPPNLQYLKCNNSLISNIHNIPNSLKFVDCSHNKLNNLSDIKLSNIETLICNDNNLRILPQLPDNLKTLCCHKNSKLKYLPKLPKSLQLLYCYGCLVNHIPNIPTKILLINIDRPIVSVDDIELYEKSYEKHYIYSPHKNLLLLPELHNSVYLVDHYVKFWYASNIIGNWFLDCKYNPKYKYCIDRLQKEYRELYED
jgi:hypothetical protein